MSVSIQVEYGSALELLQGTADRDTGQQFPLLPKKILLQRRMILLVHSEIYLQLLALTERRNRNVLMNGCIEGLRGLPGVL